MTILLALVMCVGMLNLTVFAEDVTYTDVGTAVDLVKAVGEGKNVRLVDDIDLTGRLEIITTVTLDLNGQTLDLGEDYLWVNKPG